MDIAHDNLISSERRPGSRLRCGRRRRDGFTLIEVLVTTVLVSVAIVGVMQGIAATERADANGRTAELLQRLASEKLGDLAILTSPSANGTEGDFSDRGYPKISYSVTDDQTNVANLDQVTVTATEGKQSQAITTQMYVIPTTSSSTTTTSGGAGT